jgi:hypothetical protein
MLYVKHAFRSMVKFSLLGCGIVHLSMHDVPRRAI